MLRALPTTLLPFSKGLVCTIDTKGYLVKQSINLQIHRERALLDDVLLDPRRRCSAGGLLRGGAGVDNLERDRSRTSGPRPRQLHYPDFDAAQIS